MDIFEQVVRLGVKELHGLQDDLKINLPINPKFVCLKNFCRLSLGMFN